MIKQNLYVNAVRKEENMSMVIPNPRTHSDVAVNQHLVPQCYMREWSYNGGRSVWVFDKTQQYNEQVPEASDWSIISRKTDKINAIDNFYDLKAGSLYMPEDALEEIWGVFREFHVYLNGEKLDSLEKMNRNYFQFSAWEIRDSNGLVISQCDKDKIYQYLINSRYTYIETKWARKYENNWRDYIKEIERKVRQLKALGSKDTKECLPTVSITQADIALLMKYLLIYDWRSFEGNGYFNEIIEAIISLIPEINDIEIPETERIHQEDKTVMDEIVHNIRLKYYIDFLKNDSGVIRSYIEEYENNLTVCFNLTDPTYPFITSNIPAFVFNREDGLKEHILVARPTMLISLGRGESEHFVVSNLSKEHVDTYNKGIAKHGSLIIVPTNPFDMSRLFR